MAEFPALPLFTDSYLGDTRHLSTLQHGAYLLMLMVAWRTSDCALPNDDIYLARVTGLDKRTWIANKDILLSFWRLNGQQKWEQGRLKDERKFVEQLRNKNSASGKASALKRNNRQSTTVQPNSNKNSTPIPTPIPKESVAKATSSTSHPLPDWLPLDAWQAFLEMRKGLKAAPTEYSKKLLINQLDKLRAKGNDPVAVLEQSIRKGWKDFFELKGDIYATHQQHHDKYTESKWVAEGKRLAAKYREQALAAGQSPTS